MGICSLIQLRDNRSGHYRVQAEKINYFAKIEELSRPGETKWILNALRGSNLYDGDPEQLANRKPEEIRKINGLGSKSVSIIAKALEGMGVIKDAEKWLKV